jgi:predicted unusual protein kinase regulating ubiquinone biosynthesis (AarF/ABC1/UbiB family)
VARSIASDVDNVATLLRLARLLPVEMDVSGIIAEAKHQLEREVDYLREAESQRRYGALVADEPAFLVPAVHADLTTRRILAMDRVHGLPIEELAGADAPQARRDAAAALLQRLVFRELFEFGFMQTDPNFANYLLEEGSDRIALLDFGSAREFPAELIERYKHICRAVLAGDREGVRRAAVEIGYLAPGEREDRARGLVDLILLVCEPLRHAGVYDFGRSQLAARARDAGFDLMLRGFLHAPPPETIFLHRKLAGSFLLCAKIGARVDAHALVAPLLQE